MLLNPSGLFGKSALLGVTAAAVVLAWAPPTEARITKIEIDAARSQSPTFGGYS